MALCSAKESLMLNSSESLPLLLPEVLALTPRWLVVSKPPGMLTIPGRKSPIESSVLLDWAREHYSPIWVVHRLDRETSGVVLFARTAEDHQQANSWFQQRQTKKVYHCLASGIPTAPVFKVSTPIEGAPSTTQVEVKESYQEGFLARVLPRTGRRHQIRIHLSESGYPIWGDPLYRGLREVPMVSGSSSLSIPRVALHASSLELPTGEVFEASFPQDFESWLGRLRKEGHRV